MGASVKVRLNCDGTIMVTGSGPEGDLISRYDCPHKSWARAEIYGNHVDTNYKQLPLGWEIVQDHGEDGLMVRTQVYCDICVKIRNGEYPRMSLLGQGLRR